MCGCKHNIETDRLRHQITRYFPRRNDLLISDAASYIMKKGQMLKTFCSQILHILYIAHFLHNCAMKSKKKNRYGQFDANFQSYDYCKKNPINQCLIPLEKTSNLLWLVGKTNFWGSFIPFRKFIAYGNRGNFWRWENNNCCKNCFK